jgi:hypothetical protein
MGGFAATLYEEGRHRWEVSWLEAFDWAGSWLEAFDWAGSWLEAFDWAGTVFVEIVQGNDCMESSRRRRSPTAGNKKMCVPRERARSRSLRAHGGASASERDIEGGDCDDTPCALLTTEFLLFEAVGGERVCPSVSFPMARLLTADGRAGRRFHV